MAAEVRCFFALCPPAELAGRLFALGAPIGGRRMREDTLHMTLAFLGDVPAARIPELCRVADGLALPASALVLDCLGYWERKHLCWAGPTRLPADFNGFVDALHANLRAQGFPLEARNFVAHVTLLRNVRENLETRLLEPPLIWSIDRWHLMASLPDGPGRRYESLGEWPVSAGHQA